MVSRATSTTTTNQPAPDNNENNDQAIDLSIDQGGGEGNEISALGGAQVEDMFQAIQDPATLERVRTFVEDVTTRLFTLNTLAEVVLIVMALLFGWLVRRGARPVLQNIIGGMSVPYAVKSMLRNMTRLLLHGVALLMLLIGMGVMTSLQPDWNTNILTATSKLLSAWILIRILAQIISNQFLRNIIVFFGWSIAALSIIGIMPQTLNLMNAIGISFGDTRISFLTVLKAGIILTLLLAAAQFFGKVTEQRLRANSSLTPSAQVLIGKLIRIFLISLALLFGITLAGIDLSALAIFGGALGLGIGFGLQKVISNLFSGILLLADRSIKPGDIIEMPDGVFGWIGQLNARYVSIVTRDNKEYLVPNEDFVTQPVINWSYTNRLIRIETKFGVHYDSDPHFVKKLAEEAAASTPRAVPEPKPVCHLVEFGDSSLNFVLRFWIEDAENGVTNTIGPVMLALWDAFKEHDIKIPYPHREVFMHKDEKTIS